MRYMMTLADGVGFEPTRPLRACRFSRPVPSTARPPILGNYDRMENADRAFKTQLLALSG